MYQRTGWNKGKTPCDTCPKPILLPANEWLWELFCSLTTQVRLGGLGGFIGFDYNALHFLLKVKDIPESLWPYVLEKLELLSAIAQQYWNKQDEDKK